jgi:hypothetical protein
MGENRSCEDGMEGSSPTRTRLSALADELGYWPATTDEDHLAELRRQNAYYHVLIAQDPEGTKWQKMMGARRGAQDRD